MNTLKIDTNLLQDKKAQTNFGLMREITERWSPRVFAPISLSKGEINVLFEAARWSASSRNEQPWAFIIGQKDDNNYPQLLDCLNEWNQKWAKNAPLIGIALAKKNFDHKNLPNAHALYDLGMAMANLSLQANHMNLFVHQMGGFHANKVMANFDVPENYVAVVAFVIGYFDETLVDELPTELQDQERAIRVRKHTQEFVFGDKFGTTSPNILPFGSEN